MADDKRTYDLTAITASELQTLLSTLALDIDDPSFSDGESKKLALNLLLQSSSAVGSNIQHQALTPKGFAASLANTSNAGIVEEATETEIKSETADKYLHAGHLPAIRDLANKARSGDNNNGRPLNFNQDGGDEPNSVVFNVTLALEKSTSDVDAHYIYPCALGATKTIKMVQVIGVYYNNGSYDLTSGFYKIDSEKYINLGGSNFYIWIPTPTPGGGVPRIVITTPGTYRCALKIALVTD